MDTDSPLRSPLLASLGSAMPGLFACAFGRALDFATTWVALDRGAAAEAKPVAAGLFARLGPQVGLLVWEFAITTPVIFLGCAIARYVLRRRCPPTAHGGAEFTRYLLFYGVGWISALVASHNFQFLR